jgi:hypothetical protein
LGDRRRAAGLGARNQSYQHRNLATLEHLQQYSSFLDSNACLPDISDVEDMLWMPRCKRACRPPAQAPEDTVEIDSDGEAFGAASRGSGEDPPSGLGSRCQTKSAQAFNCQARHP